MYVIMPVIRAIVYGAARRGASPECICQAAGVSLADLNQAQQRLFHTTAIAIWEQAIEQTGDETLGLSIGQQASPGIVGLIGYLMQSSPTLAAAFRQLEVYNSLITDMLYYHAAIEDHSFVCRFRPSAAWLALSPQTAQQAVLHAMAGTLQVFELLCGKQIRPQQVKLQSGAAQRSLYEQFFSATVFVDQEENALFFPARLADEPLVTFNDGLMRLLQQQASQELLVQHQRGVAELLRGQLLKQAAQHWPSLEEVASQLQLHPRQLQRSLAAEGCSYRQLLEQVRQQLNEGLCQQGNYSQQRLADYLGYSDTSTYRRALRRWKHKGLPA